ncbi:MAG: hypothetical protein HY705_06925 [Gemmatimonadetes bacterium]|nr:hypothetical protein [Gemmatimonadota bacterium]
MALPQTNGLRLTRETLEQHLGTMTVEQGRQAYLAYGNLSDTIQTLRVLAHGHGASEKAVAHAIKAVRRGAAEIARIPLSRALSRGSSVQALAS